MQFMARSKPIYKIIFHNQGKLYELHAKQVHTATGLLGFVEVDGLLVDTASTILLDPSAERLRSEFAGTRRLYVPVHAVVRIEEEENLGCNKLAEVADRGENVMAFPAPFMTTTREPCR